MRNPALETFAVGRADCGYLASLDISLEVSGHFEDSTGI